MKEVLKIVGLILLCFAPIAFWLAIPSPKDPPKPKILKVCDPRQAVSCNCENSDLKWENGMVFCVEKR